MAVGRRDACRNVLYRDNKKQPLMTKKAVESSDAPRPIGPYSQAIEKDRMVFLSGQVAIDPVSGRLVQDSIEAETHRVMQNLKAVLAAAGLDFSHVVKTTIFLSDMGYFPEVNAVYAGYFSSPYPARETVQVAALPLKARVEISMIAVR